MRENVTSLARREKEIEIDDRRYEEENEINPGGCRKKPSETKTGAEIGGKKKREKIKEKKKGKKWKTRGCRCVGRRESPLTARDLFESARIQMNPLPLLSREHFFSRFRLFVFFQQLGAERGVCKAIFNPFERPSTSLFSLFFLARHPSTSLSSPRVLFFLNLDRLPIQARRNYAGFSSGDTAVGRERERERGVRGK